MKISSMISPRISANTRINPWRSFLRMSLLILIISTQTLAGSPPKQLSQVIDQFMNMDSTSLEIHQVIEWRFSKDRDTLKLQMDINASRNFRLTLARFGMEIFVSETEMMTINHGRMQVLYENASPDVLLEQIFVGGDLNDARYKREKKLKNGLRQLDFKFSSDFSDWESLSVILDDTDTLQQLILVDYDGNKYRLTLQYKPMFEKFVIPDVQTDYLHYQIADLRG